MDVREVQGSGTVCSHPANAQGHPACAGMSGIRRLERDLIYKPCELGHFALATLTLALCRCRLPASATRLRFWRNVDATLLDSPRCCTCAGSLPGIGRASPYFAPCASIHFQTASGSLPSTAVTSTARPWP